MKANLGHFLFSTYMILCIWVKISKISLQNISQMHFFQAWVFTHLLLIRRRVMAAICERQSVVLDWGGFKARNPQTGKVKRLSCNPQGVAERERLLCRYHTIEDPLRIP